MALFLTVSPKGFLEIYISRRGVLPDTPPSFPLVFFVVLGPHLLPELEDDLSFPSFFSLSTPSPLEVLG